jgi:hypothetical protein
MEPDQLPTPGEIAEASELAVLAVLDTALDMSVRALIAAHPELCGDHFPRTRMKAALCGNRLMNLACQLQAAVARYRLVTLRRLPLEPESTDDLDSIF